MSSVNLQLKSRKASGEYMSSAEEFLGAWKGVASPVLSRQIIDGSSQNSPSVVGDDVTPQQVLSFPVVHN